MPTFLCKLIYGGWWALIKILSLPNRQIGELRFYGVAKKKLTALQEFRNRSDMGENVGLVQQMWVVYYYMFYHCIIYILTWYVYTVQQHVPNK